MVINFYNEAENIHMAPLSLSKQTYVNFEVILVDDGSTDGTAALLLDSYEHLLPKVKLFTNKTNLGLRPARNLGVKKASGGIIITLDIHTTFNEDFIQKIVDQFNSNPKLGAVGSLVLPLESKWYAKGMGTLSLFFFLIRQRMRKYTWVNGGSAAYRTKALEDIAYLSENEVAEDVDASWKLIDKSWGVIILEDNIVFHKSTYQSFSHFFKLFFFGGVRTTYLLFKHKKQALFPQSLATFLFFPVVFLLLFLSPWLFVSLLLGYLVGFTLTLSYLTKQGLKQSFFGTLISGVLINMSSLGMLYCLLGRSVGKKIAVK